MHRFTSPIYVFGVAAIVYASQPLVAAQQTTPPYRCTSDRDSGGATLAKPLTDLYARDLIMKYGLAPEVPVRFENKEGTSLTIADAKVVLANHPSGEGYKKITCRTGLETPRD